MLEGDSVCSKVIAMLGKFFVISQRKRRSSVCSFPSLVLRQREALDTSAETIPPTLNMQLQLALFFIIRLPGS